MIIVWTISEAKSRQVWKDVGFYVYQAELFPTQSL